MKQSDSSSLLGVPASRKRRKNVPYIQTEQKRKPTLSHRNRLTSIRRLTDVHQLLNKTAIDEEHRIIYILLNEPETMKCTQLIVGDQYSDLETMNFLGAKLVGAVGEAPPMWTLCATPRALMDALQERGFELKLAQNMESSTTWIMSKPDKPEKSERKRKGSSPPPPYEKADKIQSEDSMHSMPRGPRKVPVKTKQQSKEGVEMSVTVVGAEPPHDENHHHSKHAKGEKKEHHDEDGNPVMRGSVDSMAAAESEHDTYSARPTSASGKTKKSKQRPDTPATYDVKQHPSKHSESSDEEDHKTGHDDSALTVKKRKSPTKEKKSSPKKGSKRSIED